MHPYRSSNKNNNWNSEKEKILDNTIILFCSDHGEMLGEHGLYAKRVMYENSCNIPMIISGVPNEKG